MKMTNREIIIDGAHGEGGGQIIRTSLALSMITGRPIRIHNIRAKRKKTGLLRQHLTALNAAAEICGATLSGNELGSSAVTFHPGMVEGGNFTFKVGTAGSTSLVLQTLLPALMVADRKSEIVIEGGTHNPFAPPYPFLEKAFIPLINRMGPTIHLELERYGFYPAGGGRIVATISPCKALKKLEIPERGPQLQLSATSLLCRVPTPVAERELKNIGKALNIPDDRLLIEQTKDALGAGNVLMCMASDGNITELITGFGERGVTAEQVARKVVREVREYMEAEVPVGQHLADQLMIPMAMAGAGSFRTLAPTLHAQTNMEIIQKFYDINLRFEQESERVWRYETT